MKKIVILCIIVFLIGSCSFYNPFIITNYKPDNKSGNKYTPIPGPVQTPVMTPTSVITPTPGDSTCGQSQWIDDTIYIADDLVYHTGIIWKASGWNIAVEPGTETHAGKVWSIAHNCNAPTFCGRLAWNPLVEYAKDFEVYYNNTIWAANWVTSEEPTDQQFGAWRIVASCN